ncbi:MAG: hypothetical protein M1833_002259 [Piccolia ochrophora]|nr:MAG: hypothetical protein M1833_002259 [Piccolia ochrophora]
MHGVSDSRSWCEYDSWDEEQDPNLEPIEPNPFEHLRIALPQARSHQHLESPPRMAEKPRDPGSFCCKYCGERFTTKTARFAHLEAWCFFTSQLVKSKAPGLGGLGSLAVLPPEIRRVIWRMSFSAQQRNIPTHSSWEIPERTLALLRTSQQIHEEATRELYCARVLSLLIDADAFDWSCPGPPLAFAPQFRHTIFARFKHIRIEILAPDILEESQVGLVRRQAKDITTLLRKARYLPPVTFVFVDTECGRWTKSENEQRIVARHLVGNGLMSVLRTFLPLNGATRFTIEHAQASRSLEVIPVFRNLAQEMSSE